jgi:predicted nucleotidyltransferase
MELLTNLLFKKDFPIQIYNLLRLSQKYTASKTMKIESILMTLEANRDTILSFGVRQLGVFGSCARGEQTETSDLDFLVEFDDPTFDNYFDLKFFLEKLFDSQVDLVIKDTIKPRIRSTILAETVYAGL